MRHIARHALPSVAWHRYHRHSFLALKNSTPASPELASKRCRRATALRAAWDCAQCAGKCPTSGRVGAHFKGAVVALDGVGQLDLADAGV